MGVHFWLVNYVSGNYLLPEFLFAEPSTEQGAFEIREI